MQNSITHFEVFTTNDVDQPSVLDMSWNASSTITSDNLDELTAINITFLWVQFDLISVLEKDIKNYIIFAFNYIDCIATYCSHIYTNFELARSFLLDH